MVTTLFVLGWVFGGAGAFFLARGLIHSSDGPACRPITVGTLIGLAFAILIAPATGVFSLLCLAVCLLFKMVEWLKPNLNRVVLNPCQRFAR